MKIGHVAMYVHNLEKARDFFITYFGAVSNLGYHNPKTGLRTFFLSFDDGTRLELMNIPGLQAKDEGNSYAGYTHIAFNVGSEEKVDQLTARLKSDGYRVLSGPRTTGDGYYESCVADCENNIVEITV